MQPAPNNPIVLTKYLYRTLTWPEARDRAQQGSVIVIPVAAIEQHGYCLPIDRDNAQVQRSSGHVVWSTSPRKPLAAPTVSL